MRFARHKARTRTEAQVAASRLPSFHFQTRTRTVIGRPYRGANSVSLVPARIALQGGETREHRCDRRLTVFPSFGLAICPCPSQEESTSGLWPLHFRGPRDQNPANFRTGEPRYASSPSAFFAHTGRRVLAEPSKDNKKQGSGQFFFGENGPVTVGNNWPQIKERCSSPRFGR